MHWIENAFANVNMEALNGILVWTINLFRIFKLDIGSGESVFETTINVTGFIHAIGVLAMFIVISGAMLKLWITIMSPFGNAEEPGAILVRTIGAGIGVYASLEIFKLIEKGFNSIYGLFVTVYKGQTKDYNELIKNMKERTAEDSSGTTWGWDVYLGQGEGMSSTSGAEASGQDQGIFNLNFFGGDEFIKNVDNPGLGILLMELIIGCTLMIAFFRLVLEVYERYVLLGVMYITCPLAFASIIGRDSQIFRNWFNMLMSQYVLLCTNLVFIGGFIGAWYRIMNDAMVRAEQSSEFWIFKNHQQYFTTMFIMIGWLIIGQKLDQHLKGLGLSAAQTGAGIAGALLGGAAMVKTTLGYAGSAMGTIAGGAHKAITGQTAIQRSIRDGTGPIGNTINDKRTASNAARAEQNLRNNTVGPDFGSKYVGQDVKNMKGAEKVAAMQANTKTAQNLASVAQTQEAQNIAGDGISRFSAENAYLDSAGSMEKAYGEGAGSVATYVDADSHEVAMAFDNFDTAQKFASDNNLQAVPVKMGDQMGGAVYSNSAEYSSMKNALPSSGTPAGSTARQPAAEQGNIGGAQRNNALEKAKRNK